MPELPEVENVVQSLKPIEESSLNIKEVIQAETVVLKYNEPEDFKQRVEGRLIYSIERRGKFILMTLLDYTNWNTELLIVHLGMTGALLHVPNEEAINVLEPKLKNHIFVKLRLADDSLLIYTDYRRFGSVRVVSQDEFETRGSLSHLKTIQEMGTEPFDPYALESFKQSIRHNRYKNKPIKDVLLNQRVIAGVGNIYASECLFRPQIDPYTHVIALTDEDLENIFHELVRILKLSISLGGSSIKDYVNSEGQAGTFQDHLQVYAQGNCKVCKTLIDVSYIRSRVTYFCPTCQKEKHYTLV